MINLSIPDIKLFDNQLFHDERGYFYENFNNRRFCNEIGHDINFVQDNISKSKKNVVRGLHFQISPMAQAKLISVIQGEIFDVAVDVRPESSTFSKHVSVLLSSDSSQSLFIPTGFAHGFQVLSEQAIVTYKTSEYYSKKHERSIIWNDKDLDIHWPLQEALVSDKDKTADSFQHISEEISLQKI